MGKVTTNKCFECNRPARYNHPELTAKHLCKKHIHQYIEAKKSAYKLQKESKNYFQ